MYLTVVERDWWWYCSDWTCEDFLFGHTWVWTWDLWISSPALYHCATVDFWFSHSDNFKYLTLVQRDWWWYCSDWSCERFSFCPHWGLNPGTSRISSLALYQYTTGWLLVFTSDKFRYLTLVQRDWWWYCSDWSCERFSFWPHWGLNPGPAGSLVLHSTTVPQQVLGFHLRTISGI